MELIIDMLLFGFLPILGIVATAAIINEQVEMYEKWIKFKNLYYRSSLMDILRHTDKVLCLEIKDNIYNKIIIKSNGKIKTIKEKID